ncbi:tetratricopeptide repeat protein [Rhizobium sp. L1K21]|uniref:tetratricopeptide repeat protein n=1 Tax=Rhizobium sp. L1K21 TaxID=2954933 RepID=UPI002092FFBC|nr:tetratricopeptide repeat protein [Rhizobium sp. L1K21]MCO6185060.1 sel1 repeat family protein [Rhizobium sp. L1K21]
MTTRSDILKVLLSRGLAPAGLILVAVSTAGISHAQDLPGVATGASTTSSSADSDAGASGNEDFKEDGVFSKKSRLAPVLNFDSGKGEQEKGFTKNGEPSPSAGTGVFERMGIDLPPLPPEKPFKGEIDEAFGAYQRGLYITAVDLALPRAQLGDPAAQTLLGEILSQGLGVKRDLKGAAFWYSKAAEGGDPNGMFKYALILMEGQFAKQDKKRADELMHKAADAGNALAQFNWAQILVSQTVGTDGLRDAMPYYEKAAEKGIADAQYALSQIYLNLPGLDDEKRQEAKVWLARAAKAGYDTAQYDMAVWLINGVEFDQDLKAGFQWMRIAAMNGHVLAANRLAHLYIEAIGTEADPVEAAKWYIISRRAGLQDASLEDYYYGIDNGKQKAAIDAANRFRRG